MSVWISALWTLRMIGVAEARGLSAQDMWRIVGVDPSTLDAETRIPDDRHLAAWEHMMRALSDPAIPLEVGRAMQIDDYGALTLASKTASNLRDALHRCGRYLAIFTNAVELHVHEGRGNVAKLELRRVGAQTLGARGSIESAVVELLGAARALTGLPLAALRACFRHKAPRDIRAHVRFFECPVVFGADFDGFEIAKSELDARLLLADEGLSRFVLAHLEQRAQTNQTNLPAFVDQARLWLVRRLPSGSPSLDDAAQGLGISTRTLQRRLREEGTSFQDLMTEARRTLAEQLLAGDRHAVGEIAFLLGFSEVSAFHRAFRRWTGLTPAVFRKQSRRPSAMPKSR